MGERGATKSPAHEAKRTHAVTLEGLLFTLDTPERACLVSTLRQTTAALAPWARVSQCQSRSLELCSRRFKGVPKDRHNGIELFGICYKGR